MCKVIERDFILFTEYKKYRSVIDEIESCLPINRKINWQSEDSLVCYIHSIWEDFPENLEPTYKEWCKLDKLYRKIEKHR